MNNKKTGEDFKSQAKLKNITEWHIRNCSICNYPLGYYFHEDGRVFYDNGCDCGFGKSMNIRSWDNVAEHYNMQDYPSVIEKMNNFWGFTSEKTTA